MLVNEIMTKDVATINSENTVLEACKRYHRLKIGCLVVMDEQSMVGIVTERDIINRIIIIPRDPSKTKVEEIMSKDIIFIHPAADVKEAADIMVKNKIKKLPVISDDGTLVGIITITDIVNIMPNFLRTFAMGDGSKSY
jgi:CBS domain-containing protein